MSQTRLPISQTSGVNRGNRRATVRYRCAPATIGKVYVSDDHEFQHAWVLNLSQHGVGLLLPRAVPIGQIISIHVKTIDQNQAYELCGQVAHCTELPQGEWNVGCELTAPLSLEDLDRLL